MRLLDPAAAIVRTSLIMGDAESEQVRLCLDLIAGRIPGALFSDEYRCPYRRVGSGRGGAGPGRVRLRRTLNVAGPDAVSRVETWPAHRKAVRPDAATVPARTSGRPAWSAR